MPSAATLGRWRPPEDVTGGRKVWMLKNVYILGMLYAILWLIGYAVSIAGIEIEIWATEAASEAAKLATKLISKINVLSYVC